MPYRIETGTNYFEVYDISVLPNVRVINYPKKDTKFRIASATEVVFIGNGEKVLMYEEGTQPPIPMVFDYTELQNGLLPFISFDALLLFLRQNTGLGFNTPAGGSAGLSEANVFTEDNTFVSNVEISGSCIAGVGDFGALTAVELASPPTTAELEELQWKVFVVAGAARVYVNIGGTIFSSGLFS